MNRTHFKNVLRMLVVSAVLTVGVSGAFGRDVTFLHISDQHYNKDSEGGNLGATIKDMNALPGVGYPPALGGKVDKPRGVILTGDLTNDGTPEQWEKFVADWGLTGKDGLIEYPVYEGAGNHDGAPSSADKGDAGYARRQIAERNKSRVGVVNKSANGLHYSWDWDDVHFVHLNEYAGAEDDERYTGNMDYGRKRQSYGNPAQESLQFLEQDLASQVGRSGRPVILIQHYGLFGFPIHPWGDKEGWWTEEQALRLWEVIEGYNVIAVLGGHDGSENVFDWHGIQNRLMDDDVRYGVYHVTDDKMTVAKRNSQTKNWEEDSRQTTIVNASLPPELAQGPYLVYNGAAGEMTVCWRTNSNVKCTLKWDDDQFFYKDGSVEVEPYDKDRHLYKHTITDLKPNASVNYTLEINGKYAPGMFYASPAGLDKVKFFVVGGNADMKNRDRLYQTIYDRIYADAAYHSILLSTGAMVPDVENMEAWDRQMFSREPEAKHISYVLRRLPIVCAPGKSELQQELFPYNYGGDGRYSFNYGPVHVAVINSEEGLSPESDQRAWLCKDLESATAEWKFVVAGPTGDGDAGREPFEELEPICRTYSVEMCLSNAGAFSRTDKDGVTYVKIPGNDPEAWAIMSVRIEGNTMTCETTDASGKVIDTFTRVPNAP